MSSMKIFSIALVAAMLIAVASANKKLYSAGGQVESSRNAESNRCLCECGPEGGPIGGPIGGPYGPGGPGGPGGPIGGPYGPSGGLPNKPFYGSAGYAQPPPRPGYGNVGAGGLAVSGTYGGGTSVVSGGY